MQRWVVEFLSWAVQPVVTVALMATLLNVWTKRREAQWSLVLGRTERFDAKAFDVIVDLWARWTESLMALSEFYARVDVWIETRESPSERMPHKVASAWEGSGDKILLARELLLSVDIFLPESLQAELQGLGEELHEAWRAIFDATGQFDMVDGKPTPRPFEPADMEVAKARYERARDTYRTVRKEVRRYLRESEVPARSAASVWGLGQPGDLLRVRGLRRRWWRRLSRGNERA